MWVEKSDRIDLWSKSICDNGREILQDDNEASYVEWPGGDDVDKNIGGRVEGAAIFISS